jgi:hypothetical protein
VRIQTNDGAVFAGRSANAIVRKMADCRWNAPEEKREWKEEVVDRVWQMTGVRVPVDNPTEFLLELSRLGLVRLLRNGVQMGPAPTASFPNSAPKRKE